MSRIIPEPPPTQRVFANGWAELDYLCKKIRYWLYSRNQRSAAMHYSERLTRVLSDLPESGVAILREEGLALRWELQGNLAEAITHRRREINLMERLHRDCAFAEVYKEGEDLYVA